MTDEELVERMIEAFFAEFEKRTGRVDELCDLIGGDHTHPLFRAALAVARPAIEAHAFEEAAGIAQSARVHSGSEIPVANMFVGSLAGQLAGWYNVQLYGLAERIRARAARGRG